MLSQRRNAQQIVVPPTNQTEKDCFPKAMQSLLEVLLFFYHQNLCYL